MTTVRIIRTLRELNRAQWLSTDELRGRSEARLAQLLRHARENVPFYRGLDPDRVPVMDKSAYRSHAPEAFNASNLPAQRRIEKATSGSTGVPFHFATDSAALTPRLGGVGVTTVAMLLQNTVELAEAQSSALSPQPLQPGLCST